MTFLQRWGELAGGIRGESVRRGEGVALVHLISTITRMALLVCTQKLGESGGMLPQEIFFWNLMLPLFQVARSSSYNPDKGDTTHPGIGIC